MAWSLAFQADMSNFDNLVVIIVQVVTKKCAWTFIIVNRTIIDGIWNEDYKLLKSWYS